MNKQTNKTPNLKHYLYCLGREKKNFKKQRKQVLKEHFSHAFFRVWLLQVEQ